MNKFAGALIAVSCLVAIDAWAIYKCVSSSGQVTFQEAACGTAEKATEIKPLYKARSVIGGSTQTAASLTSRLDGTRWQVGGVAPGGGLETFHPVPWSFDGKGGFQAPGHWTGRYEVVGPGKLSAAIVDGGGATDQFTIEFDDDLTTFRASKRGAPYRHATRIAQPK